MPKKSAFLTDLDSGVTDLDSDVTDLDSGVTDLDSGVTDFFSNLTDRISRKCILFFFFFARPKEASVGFQATWQKKHVVSNTIIRSLWKA